jgi:hypothetical protein
MEFIKGRNIYDCDFDYETKKSILKSLISALKALHESEEVAADTFSIEEAYFNKTIDRLAKIQDLIPFARDREIVINGRKCRNVYYHKRELQKRIEKLKINCHQFAFIHGDCTFSNLMVREDNSPVLIDPRGYFGFSELYGDVRYDWAKLYYSVVGNYDQFNLKRFRLEIGDTPDKGVHLQITSNHWEELENDFFDMTGADTDLLQTPSYSFDAKTTDYESRFKLVFSTNEADGPSTGSGTFAFVNNGEIIINGEGMLQVIDMTGRIIINRVAAGHVSTNGMTPGVYVLRLINGDDVKTQKMVLP